jgi:hypothetical protein
MKYSDQYNSEYNCKKPQVDANGKNNDPSPTSLAVGDRVIWISDSDNAERGTVRWIGVLPGGATEVLFAGVEFVSLNVKCKLSNMEKFALLTVV